MIKEKKKVLEAFQEFLDAVYNNTVKENIENSTVLEQPDKILTFKEVCSYFQISPTTLERRVRAGLKFSQAAKKGNRLFKLTECKKFFNLNY